MGEEKAIRIVEALYTTSVSWPIARRGYITAHATPIHAHTHTKCTGKLERALKQKSHGSVGNRREGRRTLPSDE